MEKTKLKAALKQVNDYFRDKIVAGDYTVEERSDVKFRVEDKLKAFKIIKKDIAETIGKEREAKEREEFKRLQKKFAQ